ncbi:hypothetical protein ACFVSN_01070 [Kitasatospora sp. NPDC057904]|uniref:hypothetical protein n=1 Tax=unclassified Kitasatospora TaxID=2633591 RepID=UPI0036D7F903
MVRPGRRGPIEQHIHSFLEVLPLTAVAFTACLHWDQVRSLLRGGDSHHSWRLYPKSRPLSAGYLAGFTAAVTAFIALPYGEELLRCARAQSRRSKNRP